MIHKDIRVATEHSGLIRGEDWKIEVANVSVIQKPTFVFFIKRGPWLRREQM
jgi:hypothetical protein